MGFEPTTPTLARLCSISQPGYIGARRQARLQGGVNGMIRQSSDREPSAYEREHCARADLSSRS